ncbi:glycosyltransferase [Microbulbifer sp. OS29]|uniref:Glycosyltransferase n=1 Tax=Microbulbifer okhotskensis TaxID=2926617 RepID=A0A9X2EQI9_9GAMM|nr:glycosyltransferase [Microbulbifer okhotskensis]MCO1335935.1 glycosyltransferase [Microbulbifer okhotskensis]
MSVLLFSNLLCGVSGLDKSVVYSANSLAKDGYDVHLINVVGRHGGFCEATPKFELSDKVKLYSLQSMYIDGGAHATDKFEEGYNLKQKFLTATFSKHDLHVIRGILESLCASDTVIFTHPLQSVLAYRSNAKLRARTLLQIHGNYEEEVHNLDLLIESKVVIDYLQVVSEAMIPGLSRVSGFPVEQIVFIPNIHLPALIEREQVKDKFAVCIVGSLQVRKNQLDAIKAIEGLLEDHNDLELHLWGGVNNDYGKYIRKYIENKGLSKNIILNGLGTEAEIYKNCDLVVMTSVSEGFPYIMMEAGSQGIPLVVYDFKYGAKDFVEDGVNGYVVPWGDIEEMSKCILMLKNNPNLLLEYGARCKEKFHSEFSEDSILRRYQDLIGVDRAENFFASDWVRNISSIVKPKLKKHERVTIFNRHVFDYIEVELGEERGSVELFSYDSRGTFKRKSKIKNGVLKAKLFRPLSELALPSRKYILSIISNGEPHYILNTKMNGNVEFLPQFDSREYLSGKNDDLFEILFSECKISYDGLNIKLPSFEILRGVTNERGDFIRHQVNFKSSAGKHEYYVTVTGEFESIRLSFNSGREFLVNVPRLTIAEILSRLDSIESEMLLNYHVNGVYLWELVKVSVFEVLAEAFGLWGKHFSRPVSFKKHYPGSKKISKSPSFENVIFEFTRKGDIDEKTAALQDASSLVIEYPQSYGYTLKSYIESNVYPISEFDRVSEKISLRACEKYCEDFVEGILEEEFGVRFDFSGMFNQRLLKFKKEFSYWNKFFRDRDVKSTVIPSAYWSSGIVHAARINGVKVYDVQYALITPLHPNYGFTNRRHYCPDAIYVWSKYWRYESFPYKEYHYLPRLMSEGEASDIDSDILILSQPRIGDRLARFTSKLAKHHPDKKIIVALHPDESADNYSCYEELSLSGVEFIVGKTLSLIKSAKICIGVYSTSMYEAVALGKPVYVAPLPGSEIVDSALKEGLFRRVESLSDISEYEIPDISKEIFDAV